MRRLARLLEQGCRSGLSWRKFHACDKGCIVHPHHQNRPPAVIDYGDDAGPMIALGFRLGGGDHSLCRRQGEHFLFKKLCGHILCRESETRKNKSKCNGYTHDVFLLHGSGADTGNHRSRYRDVRPSAVPALARVP